MRQSRMAGRDAYIIAEINKAAATTEGFLPAGLDVTSVIPVMLQVLEN